MTALLLVCRGRKYYSKLEHPTKNGGPPAYESENQVDAGASWVTGPECPVGQAVSASKGGSQTETSCGLVMRDRKTNTPEM